MSNAAKNIMLRVIRRRMAEGEELEDILAGYPKLTDAEKEELRAAITDQSLSALYQKIQGVFV